MVSADQIYSDAMRQLEGYGNSEQAALKQSYQNALGMGMQSLTSSGLAGTTIAPSMRMGYMKQYQLALNDLNQKLTQARVNTQSTVGFQAIQANQADRQLGIAQGYYDLAEKQQKINAGQFEKTYDLQREYQLGSLGLQRQQADTSAAQFEKQLAATLGWQASQNELQKGYLDIAKQQQYRQDRSFEQQLMADVGMANAAASANIGQGWGQIYSGTAGW